MHISVHYSNKTGSLLLARTLHNDNNLLRFTFPLLPREWLPPDTSILISHCHAWAPISRQFLQQSVAAAEAALPSSLKVKRPIWGKSLNVSRQIVPAVRKRAMQTWSCFTKRGRVLLFSPVFLSTKQIKACIKKKLIAVSAKIRVIFLNKQTELV